MRLLFTLIGAALTGLAWNVGAYPFVTCTSTYTSNGWFEYRLTLHEDPFFRQVELIGLDIALPTNAIAVGDLPAGWSMDTNANAVSWQLTIPPPPDYPEEPLPRPLTAVLKVQSPYTSFRTSEKGLIVPFMASINDFAFTRFKSINLVGLFKLNGLVPCPPEQSDGSPPTLTTIGEAVPDIELRGFITISNSAYGISYAWDGPATMIVQSSYDGTTWTNIAYTLGNEGMNTWTSAVPLTSVGTLFRLRLYSTQQHPELVQ